MKFIVDVNLPKHFRFFNKPEFVFASDINARMSDAELWNFALENDLVILTKDTDFYSRSLISFRKPKVVYFKLGNTTIAELHEYFTKNWETICNAVETNYLIIATRDSIDFIL